MEARSAQAITARTYAAWRQATAGDRTWDVRDDTADQCYGGRSFESPRTSAAVESTAARILTYAGQPIRALFSSAHGGISENVGCLLDAEKVGTTWKCADGWPYLAVGLMSGDASSVAGAWIGASRRNATRTTATRAAPIPNTNVLAVASENARWIAATISGTNGSSSARAPIGAFARIVWPRSPTPVSRLRMPPEAGKLSMIGRGSVEAASCRGSSSSSREPKMVPAAASPTLPPICWNRVRLLVAVPIWRGDTAPCTTSVNIAKIGPTPMPVMNIQSQRSGSGVSSRRLESRKRPTARTIGEASASGLYRPVRATS